MVKNFIGATLSVSCVFDGCFTLINIFLLLIYVLFYTNLIDTRLVIFKCFYFSCSIYVLSFRYDTLDIGVIGGILCNNCLMRFDIVAQFDYILGLIILQKILRHSFWKFSRRKLKVRSTGFLVIRPIIERKHVVSDSLKVWIRPSYRYHVRWSKTYLT